MHQYLTAIGFEKVRSEKELHKVLDEVENYPTSRALILRERDMDFCEYRKEYAPGLGIAVFGDMDTNECFKKQYYFPYYRGSGITSHSDITLEQRMDRDSFVGICEDPKLEINLIFHLQNNLEYMRRMQEDKGTVYCRSVTLAGLCDEGTILLPLQKSEQQEEEQKEKSRNRSMLMSAAKAGDPAAIESLTLDDFDTYSKVSRRLVTEDIFSIVDTYIMPSGIECDQYAIMGEILNIKEMENTCTGESVYIMQLDVNELRFDICVPVSRVIGEPGIGRRFKGTIWMQGWVNF